MDGNMLSSVLEGSQGLLKKEVFEERGSVLESLSVSNDILGRPQGWLQFPERASPSELVDNYQGLIISEVNRWFYKFPVGYVDFDDLVSLGFEVLLYTQKFYKERRRCKEMRKPIGTLTTYFVWSFRNALKDLLSKCYVLLTRSKQESRPNYFDPHKYSPTHIVEFRDCVSVVRKRLDGLPLDLFDYLVTNGRTSHECLANSFHVSYERVQKALLVVRSEVNWAFKVRT